MNAIVSPTVVFQAWIRVIVAKKPQIFRETLKQGDFLVFFLCMYRYFIQHCFICRPFESTVSEDAGIEPRTVATSALAVTRSSHSAACHPLGYISSTKLHLIHQPTSHPYQPTSHPYQATSHPLGYISSTRLHLIH
jgi:hypothetical protein